MPIHERIFYAHTTKNIPILFKYLQVYGDESIQVAIPNLFYGKTLIELAVKGENKVLALPDEEEEEDEEEDGEAPGQSNGDDKEVDDGIDVDDDVDDESKKSFLVIIANLPENIKIFNGNSGFS